MKKITLLFIGLLLGSSIIGQVKSNMIFFTEQGEKFNLILNGVNQNPEAETNVKVTDLVGLNYKIKIIFQDATLGEIDKNLIIKQGMETTFVIKRNNKGRWVVRFMGEIPIAQALPPTPNQKVIVFGNVPPLPAHQTTSVSTTQTTTTVSSGTNVTPQGNINVNINDPELGVNVNMNVNTGNVNTNGQTTTYSSSSSTTTTTTTGTHQTQPNQQVYVLPGYNGAVGCPWPLSPQDFAAVKQSIASKSFEDSKLTIAKQVINSNCLLSSQVKEIMLLFSFEDTRLELAKHAYGYTFDIGNYYKLNDAFTFESSIEELNEYIGAFQR